MLHRVEEPTAANGVIGLRHGDALKEWSIAGKAGEREIADHPAISYLIIHDKWVAIVLVAARRAVAQRGKERIVCRSDPRAWCQFCQKPRTQR